MSLQSIGVDAGVALTVATNVAGFWAALRGQHGLKISVNGRTDGLLRRVEQLAKALHAAGIDVPDPPAPPGDQQRPTIDP